MIESGTHVAGITAAMFGLPPGAALRYERVDPRLARYLTDYHVLDSEARSRQLSVDWMLPSWSAIRVILSDKDIAISIGDTVYDPMPVVSLYGTTSRAMRVVTQGGVTIGAGVTPLGWARLFRQPAAAYRDRIVPLDELLDAPAIDGLVAALRASDQAREVKGILDAFFLRRIGPPSRDEGEIATLMRLLVDDDTIELADAAERFGISPVRLRRLASRYFGFPPKTLLMRARFLRSLLAMMVAQGDHRGVADYSLIAGSYCDVSHFLRDSERFLGMTPKRFLAMPVPYLRACLRARMLVMGAPTSAIDRPAAEAPVAQRAAARAGMRGRRL